jgi:NADPH:quinone reductase-like Zn-dependent oxidoreductase
MSTLAQLMETGQLHVVIDRTFPLAQAHEALQHLASGQPMGRIVLVVGG